MCGLLLQQHRRSQGRRRRRGLNSKPALPRAPKKSRDVRIKTVNRQSIRREAPKPRPASLDALDRPVDDLLEAVDRDRDVDLLGRSVARIARDFVVRAEPDRIVALPLEVKAPVGGIDERQVA